MAHIWYKMLSINERNFFILYKFTRRNIPYDATQQLYLPSYINRTLFWKKEKKNVPNYVYIQMKKLSNIFRFVLSFFETHSFRSSSSWYFIVEQNGQVLPNIMSYLFYTKKPSLINLLKVLIDSLVCWTVARACSS